MIHAPLAFLDIAHCVEHLSLHHTNHALKNAKPTVFGKQAFNMQTLLQVIVEDIDSFLPFKVALQEIVFGTSRILASI